MSVITDQIVLAGIKEVTDEVHTKKLKITHILNVASEVVTDRYDYVYRHNGLSDDDPKSDIRTTLDGNIRFMHEAIINGGTVMVHCYSGVSRSAVTVMAYLVKYQGLSAVDAYHKVLARRSIVDPWPNYLKQFQEWSAGLPTAEAEQAAE
ncbi:hypothetical protein ABBQ32_012240 [Trebouxia sp. C0010 RCD-2024]